MCIKRVGIYSKVDFCRPANLHIDLMFPNSGHLSQNRTNQVWRPVRRESCRQMNVCRWDVVEIEVLLDG